HDPASTPFRTAQCTTALAPMISRRRIVRSPLEVPPIFRLPPVDRWNGVSPARRRNRALSRRFALEEGADRGCRDGAASSSSSARREISTSSTGFAFATSMIIIVDAVFQALARAIRRAGELSERRFPTASRWKNNFYLQRSN